jgi:hypothetical protein
MNSPTRRAVARHQAPKIAPHEQENDEQLYESVHKLANAWLVMKAIDALDPNAENQDVIGALSMPQHEKVQECIAELIEVGSVNSLIGDLMRKREARRIRERDKEAAEHFAGEDAE